MLKEVICEGRLGGDLTHWLASKQEHEVGLVAYAAYASFKARGTFRDKHFARAIKNGHDVTTGLLAQIPKLCFECERGPFLISCFIADSLRKVVHNIHNTMTGVVDEY